MDTVFSVLVGLGLAAACGFRVFVPWLVAAVAVRAGHLQISSEFAWLGSDAALVTLAVATALEVGAYYIPWLDHALDTVASPAAVVAGILVTASFAVDMDPLARWSLAVIAGGSVAAGVQAGTVATRGLSFTTTGGLTNPAVATAELGGALLTSAVAVVSPVFACAGIAALAILGFTMWSRRKAKLQAVTPQPSHESRV